MITTTARTTKKVTCDTCGNTCDTSELTAKDARFEASGWGWVRVAGKDSCDVCEASRLETEEYLASLDAEAAQA